MLGGRAGATSRCRQIYRYLGHIGAGEHNAFNVSPKAVLNISRVSMAANGFSPATRVFEAAGAGACFITDAWEGIELFLAPGEEILVARDGHDVVELLGGLTLERRARDRPAARMRVLEQHTYSHRAAEADAVFRAALGRARQEAAE